MAMSGDKWFSMRADFFGRDTHTLGLLDLSPQALGTYVAAAAYASKYGISYVHKGIVRMVVGPRRCKPIITELVNAGMLIPIPGGHTYQVAHEGILWRRGRPLERRAIPDRLRRAVMERDEFTCLECGATENLTLDHIFPYSLGGRDTLENLRVLCQPCNSSKGARI